GMQRARAVAGARTAPQPFRERPKMSPRRQLHLIVAVSTVMSFIAAAGAMYFATARYERATRDAQVERASQFVERYVNEVIWQQHAEDVGTLAGDIAGEGELRKAAAAADREGLQRLLPMASHRSAVTSGQVALLGVTIYDARGTMIASHTSVPDLRPPGALGSLLAARERNERFARLRHIWTLAGAPYLSVAVPVGGLRQISGYLAVHVDPLHALRDLATRLAMHVLFASLDRTRILGELNGYPLPDEAARLNAEVVIDAPDGEPVFRVEMQSDETESARLMASIRTWSFAVLLAVLSVIAATTLALVLVVSRRMAREEADAAMAALNARRIEERNADLQRHNEMLRTSEEALQAQNQRFAAALNNMAHGMCMFDRDQRLVVCNSLYLTMYGLPPELGQPG